MQLQNLTDGTVLDFDTGIIYSSSGTSNMGIRVLPSATTVIVPDAGHTVFSAMQAHATANPPV